VLQPFLGASAVIWFGYGLVCFLKPGFLAEAAGVIATTTTGTVELRAMYGGLQMALGALAGAAFVRPSLVRPALLALAFVCGGLFTTRLLGAALGASFASYTAVGLLFELLSTTFATRLLAGSTDEVIGNPQTRGGV
jgi:hypothetical protein